MNNILVLSVIHETRRSEKKYVLDDRPFLVLLAGVNHPNPPSPYANAQMQSKYPDMDPRYVEDFNALLTPYLLRNPGCMILDLRRNKTFLQYTVADLAYDDATASKKPSKTESTEKITVVNANSYEKVPTEDPQSIYKRWIGKFPQFRKGDTFWDMEHWDQGHNLPSLVTVTENKTYSQLNTFVKYRSTVIGDHDCFIQDAAAKIQGGNWIQVRLKASPAITDNVPATAFSNELHTGSTIDATAEEGNLAQKIVSAAYSNPFALNQAIQQLIDWKDSLDLTDPDREFTAEEKNFIKQYSGNGGLEKFGATGKGLLYEYFTPEPIIETMWKLCVKHGYAGGSVLEPACGTGRFFAYLPQGADAQGFEINRYSYRICQILYPQVSLAEKSFETVFIHNNDTIRDRTAAVPRYDLVIGNPPYGDFTGRYAGMGEKGFTKAHNYVEYFITRGLDCLNPGGLLSYVVGVEVAAGGRPFLDQGWTKTKERIREQASLVDAYRLPNGVFDRTDVLTDILIFKKK